MKNICPLIILFVLTHTAIAQHKKDTIDISFNKLKMNNLKDHESSYLVTMEKQNGDLVNSSIWTRKTKIKDDKIIITQSWRNANRKGNKKIYSVLNSSNFAPIYHKVIKGTGKISAYNFHEKRIIGADSIADNVKKDFSIDVEKLPYNWELDIEFFQLLPMKLNKTFVVEFYHPGGSWKPAYYEYKVLRKEKIVMPDGQKTDTWVVKIEYSKGNEATFWIGVKNQKMLKMKEVSQAYISNKIKL